MSILRRSISHAHEFIETFGEWYRGTTLFQRSCLWLLGGGAFGHFYGKSRHRELESQGLTRDSIYVTLYHVKGIQGADSNTLKTFERVWNRHAVLAQKMKGYEYTKLYKAVKVQNFPVTYLQLRFWTSDESAAQAMNSNGDTVLAGASKQIRDSCDVMETTTFSSVFDDSIVRLIQ